MRASSSVYSNDSTPITRPSHLPYDNKPQNLQEMLLNTPTASVRGPVLYPEYSLTDGQEKASEPTNDRRELVDLSDIADEMYLKQFSVMVERHEKMWSSHLGEIKGVIHRIELKPGTHLLRQQPYLSVPKG